MLLHTRCPQRIASTSAQRTIWRRRYVRYYASDTANDDEWFHGVRNELLSRKPHHYRQNLDRRHHEQLFTTLTGFAPQRTIRNAQVSLAELLTRFNARVQSSTLLSDGTDPLHSPGEPWMRRMWAGGTVKLSPDLTLKSETPFRLQRDVACLERIKEVRLQGTGDEAKVFVTIERRFASIDVSESQTELNVQASNFKQAISDSDWSDSLVKEERNLVFMKAKTSAELTSIHSGQTLGDPKYLKSPGESDFSHTLTPTRSLLFRYSAITYNAHLLHLDPEYARYVEGHRNLLVHGPLTLTLMLQVLNRHLRQAQIGHGFEAVGSIQYRNLAPLYCDEEMRVCVKKKKRTDTGHSWDIWIEGPTGGMAVKAVAHTVDRKTSAKLPDIQTVALQAQDRLNALDHEDAGKGQLSQLSRKERRKLWRQQRRKRGALTTLPERAESSRMWREEWVGKSLPYLYVSETSALTNRSEVPRSSPQPNATLAPTPAASASRSSSSQPLLETVAANPPSALFRLRQRERATLPGRMPAATHRPGSAASTDGAARPRNFRIVRINGPEDALSLASMQRATASHRRSSAREGEQRRTSFTVRRLRALKIRKTDIPLKEAARKRAHGTKVNA